MDAVTGTGIGISVISLFLRYAIGIMPKTVAWAGLFAGAWIVVADQFGMKLGLGAIVLYVVGAICIGWALHLTLRVGPKPSPASTSWGNTIGDITGNKGIITQGQTGDNKVDK